jgi:chromosome partitioning protein
MSALFSFVLELLSTLRSHFGKGLAEVIAGVIILLLGFLAKNLWSGGWWLIDYHRRLSRALSDVGREVEGGIKREGSSGLWLAKPIGKPQFKSFDPTLPNARILVVANAKGGVGKTTIAANVAACISENTKNPVLLIDLDFQASASSMAMAGDESNWLPPPGQDSAATYLISGDLTAQQIAGVQLTATTVLRNQISPKPNLRLITSSNHLAQAENRVMIEWLLSDRQRDIRFRLKELLHSDDVRKRYSLIVLDCPPRLTTAAIQALVAGTHLLVPTILDRPSCEATVNFIRQVENLRDNKLTAISHLGAVASMIDTNQNYGEQIAWLSQRLADRWEDGGGKGVARLLPQTTYINDLAVFRNAGGKGIAYYMMTDAQAVRERIRTLADHVRTEMAIQ